VFRHCNFYESYLVGYAPDLDTFGIAEIQRFYIKERRIKGKDDGHVYILSGQAGLTHEAEKFWSETKQFTRIIFDLDISHKY